MIYLYDEDDIFDLYITKMKDNKNVTFEDVKELFMKPVHIVNSEKKMIKLRNEVIKYKELNPKIKLNIVDLYGYFSENE